MNFNNEVRTALRELLVGDPVEKIAIKKIFEDYLEYTKLKCRYQTVDYYKKFLNNIIKYFERQNIFNHTELNLNVINQIIRSLQAKGNCNNTINKTIEIAKQAFTFAVNNDIITSNPLQKFKKLPIKKVEIKLINENLVLAILKYLECKKDSNYAHLRNACLFNIFLNTAIRLNEAINLQVKHLNLDKNSIYLEYTKTGNPRIVYFNNYTKQLLIEYLDKVKPQDYLFINIRYRNKLDNRHIYEIIREIKKDLSIPQEISISPHKWRHTTATLLYSETKDIRAVQTLLGHENVNQTMKYTHVSEVVVKNMIVKSKFLNDIKLSKTLL